MWEHGKPVFFLIHHSSHFCRFRMPNPQLGRVKNYNLWSSLHIWEDEYPCCHCFGVVGWFRNMGQNRPHHGSEFVKHTEFDPGCLSSRLGLPHSEDERLSSALWISGEQSLCSFHGSVITSVIWNPPRIRKDMDVVWNQARDKLWRLPPTTDIRSAAPRPWCQERRCGCGEESAPESHSQERKVLEKVSSFGWTMARSIPNV